MHVVESLLNSQAGKESLDKAAHDEAILIAGTLWMDDFEPNRGKQNQGSVWTCLLTLESILTTIVCSDDVHPVAVGAKGKIISLHCTK